MLCRAMLCCALLGVTCSSHCICIVASCCAGLGWAGLGCQFLSSCVSHASSCCNMLCCAVPCHAVLCFAWCHMQLTLYTFQWQFPATTWGRQAMLRCASCVASTQLPPPSLSHLIILPPKPHPQSPGNCHIQCIVACMSCDLIVL